MKDMKQRLSLLTLAGVSVLVLAAAPAYAHADNDRGQDDEVATTLADTDTSGSQPAVDDTTDGSTAGKSGAQIRMLDLRNRGKAMVTQRREGKTPLGVQARQKVCANRQKAIDLRISALNRQAQRHLGQLDIVLVKITTYHSNHEATAAASYDELLATATAKQTAATSAVAALKDLGTPIDCSADDPAAGLAAVKESASATHDALKSYRMALKDLVVATAQAHKTDANTKESN